MSSFNNKFDSAKQEWPTPSILFDRLDAEFKFDLDLAASKENTKCINFYSKDDDSLKMKWDGVCWLNPPYGNRKYKISSWVQRAYEETVANSKLVVVMLIPARTNTQWFHKYCMKASEIRFIIGRPKFGDAKYGLPQPLLIVVFKQSSVIKFSSFVL